jgi:hypothetical protein
MAPSYCSSNNANPHYFGDSKCTCSSQPQLIENTYFWIYRQLLRKSRLRRERTSWWWWGERGVLSSKSCGGSRAAGAIAGPIP